MDDLFKEQRKLDDEFTMRLQHLNKIAGNILECVAERANTTESAITERDNKTDSAIAERADDAYKNKD